MRFSFIVALSLLVASCNFGDRRINGNGEQTTRNLSVGDFSAVHVQGGIDVDITPGSSYSIEVKADENLLPYIVVENRDGELVIKEKDGVDLRSRNDITVSVVMPKLTQAKISGSGKIRGKGNFPSSDKFRFSISGSGDIALDINAPTIHGNISGAGKVTLGGETRTLEMSITGSGDYFGGSLKSEEADISVTGSGTAHVFASVKLDVSITGSGDVYYSGSPSISQHITGSGSVQPEK